MARNRQLIPREQRADELVGAATELFLKNGYAKTRMGDIASSAGVANAALYWYFETKDHVLAEVWNRALDSEIELLATRGPDTDPIQTLLKGLADLRPYRRLHMSMHDRLDSEVVLAAHTRLIDWVRELARQGLAYRGHSEEESKDVADLIVVLFEGLNVPGVQARTATQVIETLLTKVLGDPVDLPAPAGDAGD
jgi:AcrR family transcriptional regulator